MILLFMVAAALGPWMVSLITPALVTDGQAVEGVPGGTPLGVVLVHEGLEAGIVSRFDQVHELVDDDVF